MTYGLSNDTFAWTIATDEADQIFIKNSIVQNINLKPVKGYLATSSH